MDNKFIYTQNQDIYEALKKLGFTDLGKVDNSVTEMYVLGNLDYIDFPVEFQNSCLLTNHMSFTASKREAVKDDA